MRVRNAAELATTPLRAQALALADAALEAIDTRAAVRRTVRLEDRSLSVAGRAHALPRGRLLLVAVGKCAAAAADALGEILGGRLAGGIVLDVGEAAAAGRVPGLTYCAGTHPMPSAANVAATRGMLALVQEAGAHDLVLAVVSGGGSTLLCLPAEGLTWEDEAAALQELFRAGATIREINTVRKHTSLARGGWLARHAFPAPVVSLVFSDVPGADLEFVASGPTARDTTTVADARAVLARHGLLRSPGIAPELLRETPKEDRYFAGVRHALVVSNGVALEAMVERARQGGLAARIADPAFAGEAREVAGRVVRELRAAAPGSAVLFGGESTVTVRAPGSGGRNCELALAALRLVREGECVVTLATDGRDNGDLAGAIADDAVRAAADRLGLDCGAFLEANDSHGFYRRAGGYLVTGATGANVADVIVALRA
ncbi:MAG: DUF4147 domain-containing protein [Gemmatimonadetes bacterium]|nr:DUF4147 domain-containing protein [Gemmatimonadota bacterium]